MTAWITKAWPYITTTNLRYVPTCFTVGWTIKVIGGNVRYRTAQVLPASVLCRVCIVCTVRPVFRSVWQASVFSVMRRCSIYRVIRRLCLIHWMWGSLPRSINPTMRSWILMSPWRAITRRDRVPLLRWRRTMSSVAVKAGMWSWTVRTNGRRASQVLPWWTAMNWGFPLLSSFRAWCFLGWATVSMTSRLQRLSVYMPTRWTVPSIISCWLLAVMSLMTSSPNRLPGTV